MALGRVRPRDKDDVGASSISRIEPEAAAVASARFIAETEVEWQSRVQWSTLLVRKPARTIRIRA